MKMPTADEIRLAAGELTAGEMRTVKAVLGWFIKTRCGEAVVDEGCICNGNWRAIVKEYSPKIGQTFKRGDKTYRFFGLVHGDDDYYYGLVEVGGKVLLSSCVGSLEMNGMEAVPSLSGDQERG